MPNRVHHILTEGTVGFGKELRVNLTHASRRSGTTAICALPSSHVVVFAAEIHLVADDRDQERRAGSSQRMVPPNAL